jgi:hypothetical protein
MVGNVASGEAERLDNGSVLPVDDTLRYHGQRSLALEGDEDSVLGWLECPLRYA